MYEIWCNIVFFLCMILSIVYNLFLTPGFYILPGIFIVGSCDKIEFQSIGSKQWNSNHLCIANTC